jgi:cupin 2 domain-containing protein
MPAAPLETGNLFRFVPGHSSAEQTEVLLESTSLRLERIASFGAASPAGFWYEQGRPEWVLLASGRATLGFEDSGSIDLEAGDYVLIPAARRHRVESTSKDATWLALHFDP